MNDKARVAWIDAAKFFGIFVIWLVHSGDEAGNAYWFAFTFSVQLFFFLSGCVASLEKTYTLKEYLVKKMRSVLIPFYVFVILSVALQTVVVDAGAKQMVQSLLDGIVKGAVRNHFVAAPLWFLSCLFVMEMLLACLRKWMHRYLVLLVCVLSCGLFHVFLLPHYPFCWYNLDSVARYSIFYAVGYCAFPALNRLFLLDSTKKKCVFAVTGTAAFGYSAMVFWQHDPLLWLPSNGNVWTDIASGFLSTLGSLITVYLISAVSRLSANIALFRNIGANTLYLCGNEYITKSLMQCFVGIFGIKITLSDPLSAYIYILLLLVLCNRYLTPLEKPLLQWVNAKIWGSGTLPQEKRRISK